MITSLLLIFVGGFLSLFLALLPTVSSLPSGVADAIAYMGVHVGAISSWFPIDTLISALAVVLSFEAGMILFWSINWIINKIRGSG